MARIRLVPPVYLLLTVLAMAGLHRLLPVTTVLRPPLSYVGAALLGLGLAVAAGAALRFAHYGTSVHPFHQPTALVTDGPYRFTRNPMYLGMVVALLGIALWLGSLTPFVVIPVFASLIQREFIRDEERRLSEAFGRAYHEYRNRVRRWL
jgi:protein-S-isoprenylcysteine O-methyltransferase Ste14